MYRISTFLFLFISLALGTYAWRVQPAHTLLSVASQVQGVSLDQAVLTVLEKDKNYLVYTVTNKTQKAIEFVDIQISKERAVQYFVNIAPGATLEVGKHLISIKPNPVLRSVVYSDGTWEGKKVNCMGYLQDKAAREEVRQRYKEKIGAIRDVAGLEQVKKSIMAEISAIAKTEEMTVITEDDGIELQGRQARRFAFTNALEKVNIIEREFAKGKANIADVVKEVSEAL